MGIGIRMTKHRHIEEIITIEGKRYKLYNAHIKKSEAESTAEYLRHTLKSVRVIPVKGSGKTGMKGYGVYVRKTD